MLKKPVVTFHSFLVEFKKDFPELCEMFPPGPTVQDICNYYAESRFRSEKVVQVLEGKQLVARMFGTARKIHVVPLEVAELRNNRLMRLTEIQQKVLRSLELLSDQQNTKKVTYSIAILAVTAQCSTGAVQQALKRLAKFKIVTLLGSYRKDLHSSTLDLKNDY